MMKVLQINKYNWTVIGGVESHLGDIAKGLGNKVAMTVLVCNDKNYTDIRRQTSDDRHQTTVYKIASLGKLFSMPISLTYPFWFLKLARQADIIHFHHPFPLGEISYLIYNFFSKKLKAVVTWHSDIYKQKLLLFFYRPFLRRFLQAVDKIIVTSPNMAKNSPFLKDFQNKIEIVPLGIDIKKFQDLNKEKINKILKKYSLNVFEPNTHLRGVGGVGEVKKPLLLAVGRLVYYKGYQYLIEAMKGVDANLLIIGNGPLEKNLRFMISDLRLEDKISIINSVSDQDLPNFFHACDIFVLPSVAKSEAFAIVQLEAMICGKPVINTNLPTGVPWVSLDKQTGLTVEPKNPQQLTKAINKLISDKGLRIKLGQNARKRVLQYFTQEKMLNSIWALYRKL